MVIAGEKPSRPSPGGADPVWSPARATNCPRHGPGFIAIPGAASCLRISGLVRLDVDATTPLPVVVGDRFGMSVLGRLGVDARTSTDWGTLRTFVRLGVQSLTGRSVSSGSARRAGGFGATGVDTFGRAQKGVGVDRAFIQFGGLTAGRASSFYDFYAHDVEMTGVTPASDPGPVNLLGWTFTPGGGVSLTLSVEDAVFRRTPVAASGFYQPGVGRVSGGRAAMLAGAVPGALVPAGHDAPGSATAFRVIDVRQRGNVPDVVAALRIDRSWGAAQLSGAWRQVNVGPFVDNLVTGIGPAARRPAARHGYAVQAGVMLRLPGVAEGDRLWLQAAAARGALNYTGANQPAGFDSPAGSAFGCIPADMFEGYIGPDGKLRLSTGWSAIMALEHFWRPDLAQTVFAGMSGVGFGAGTPAGLGQPGGFSRRIAGNRLRAVGTRLSWSPAPDLTFAVEAAWTELRLPTPRPDLHRRASALRTDESGWIGKLRVERSF